MLRRRKNLLLKSLFRGEWLQGLLSTSTPLLSAGAGSTKVVVEDPEPETSPIGEECQQNMIQLVKNGGGGSFTINI